MLIAKTKLKRGIVSLLAAGGLFLTANNCCTVSSFDDSQQVRSEQEQGITSLEQLVKSTYCLDSDFIYEDDKGNILTPGAYGSAFAYREVDGFTYLITNQHVLGNYEMELAGRKLKRIAQRTKIIDSQFDKDTSDDIPLETIFESESLDLAIVRTKAKLNVLPEKYFGDSSTLRYGEKAYLIGYPMALFPTVTSGIIANPGDYTHVVEVDEPQLNLTVTSVVKKVLDLSVNPGNSGGPFFVERDGRFYWMGIVNAYVTDHSSRNSGLALAMESNIIRQITDYVISNVNTFLQKDETEKVSKKKLMCGCDS